MERESASVAVVGFLVGEGDIVGACAGREQMRSAPAERRRMERARECDQRLWWLSMPGQARAKKGQFAKQQSDIFERKKVAGKRGLKKRFEKENNRRDKTGVGEDGKKIY